MNISLTEQQGSHGPGVQVENILIGREKELAELQNFITSDISKIFCLYGVPMIGKSALVKKFCSTLSPQQVKTTIIRFHAAESADITLATHTPLIDFNSLTHNLIVIENFEMALQWAGEHEHLHEIKHESIKNFLGYISEKPYNKLILESRFLFKNDFLPHSAFSELPDGELGKIDRKELYKAFNAEFRKDKVAYNDFTAICDKYNDHVWLIRYAMEEKWEFKTVWDAVRRPKTTTQELWDRIKEIIDKLPKTERTVVSQFENIGILSIRCLQCFLRNAISHFSY